MKHSDYGMCAV